MLINYSILNLMAQITFCRSQAVCVISLKINSSKGGKYEYKEVPSDLKITGICLYCTHGLIRA